MCASASKPIPGTPVDNTALRSMSEKIGELPMLPQVLVRVMQLDAAADDYFERFETLVMEDPPLAVRVIAFANSAESSPVASIKTIREAITRMGMARVGALVSSLAVQRVFVPTRPNQVRLWTHSIETAVAAREIARALPQLGVDPGHAYLAGLLHDIGRFVMFEHASDDLLKVDEHHWHTLEELVAADLAGALNDPNDDFKVQRSPFLSFPFSLFLSPSFSLSVCLWWSSLLSCGDD